MTKEYVGDEDDVLERQPSLDCDELGVEYMGSDEDIVQHLQQAPKVVMNPGDPNKTTIINGTISGVLWSKTKGIIQISLSDGRKLRIVSKG